MNKFTVSVIIPNFNGIHLLEKNLPHVLDASNNSLNSIFEIIIVDDASTDGSVNFLRKNFPGVRVLKHKQNRGFSAAVNSGVRTSKGDLVLLLNTDVIPKKNFLINTLRHFENPNVFGISLHEKGYGYAVGSFINGYIGLSMGVESKIVKNSFYVSGGSGIFRRDIWMALGGLDEKLLSPFYWEDIDICYRASKRGYTLLWEPDSIVEHHHESTISTLSKKYVERIRERNQLLMLWKNITSKNLMRRHIVGLFKRVVLHPGYLRIILMALTKINIVISKRKKEIKESKVSDEAIFARTL